MKKIQCIFFSLFVLASSYVGFCQQIFFEDFSQVKLFGKVGKLPEGWVLYNDNNTPSSSFSHVSEAWMVESVGGNHTAFAISWFSKAKQADRWMISPSINLQEVSKPYLIFKVRSSDQASLESYCVLASPKDISKTAFVDTLLTDNACKSDWHHQVIDLSAYKNDSLRLAFILHSYDKYALYLDDIEVFDASKGNLQLHSIKVPNIVGISQNIDGIGSAINCTEKTIGTYTVHLLINNTERFDTIIHRAEKDSIRFLNEFNFKLPSLNFSKAGDYTVKVWISANTAQGEAVSDTLATSVLVKDVSLYDFKPLIECFSSSTCSPCATANPYIKSALKSLGANTSDGKVSVIKYQVNVPSKGDPAVVQESEMRFRYYELNSAPSVMIDGSKTGRGSTWASIEDAIIKKTEEELLQKTPFRIQLTGQRRDPEFKVSAEITCLGSYQDSTLFFVGFVEDSIYHSPQSNGETTFTHILRKLLPSSDGEILTFPGTETVHHQIYSYTFDGIKPIIFNDLNGISVIAFLQNAKTKKILQSALIPSTDIVSNERTEFLAKGLRIYPNPSKEKAYLSFNSSQGYQSDIEILDISGKRVKILSSVNCQHGYNQIILPIQDLAKGVYLVRLLHSSIQANCKLIIL